jgi:hypothetical protein
VKYDIRKKSGEGRTISGEEAGVHRQEKQGKRSKAREARQERQDKRGKAKEARQESQVKREQRQEER